MLIDTHAHLNDEKFDEDRADVISRARENGIDKIVNVGFNTETIKATMKLVEEYDFIYGAVGWHPVDAKDMREGDLAWIEELTSHKRIVAVGEMGLDYHWDYSPPDIQKEVFRQQIALAKKVKLPIIIHDREAHQDIVDILREEKAEEVGGIMHCFSGSWELAKQCLDMNFHISFGGPVTFKNAKRPKEVAVKVPNDRLLVETDCPYLSPEPYRGKRNETGHVRFIAEKVAELKEMEVEEIANITTENAKRLFKI